MYTEREREKKKERVHAHAFDAYVYTSMCVCTGVWVCMHNYVCACVLGVCTFAHYVDQNLKVLDTRANKEKF
jgi:hypothetical protein